MVLKDRQEFARWTVETFQEEDPTMCKSWHERLVFLRSIKSLIIGCAVLRVGGTGRGRYTEVLVCSAKDPGTFPGGQWESWKVYAEDWYAICIFCKPLWQSSKAEVIQLWSSGNSQLTACFCLKHSIETVMCLCIVYGCFCATMPVLSS